MEKLANRMKGLKSYWNVIKWRMFTFTLPLLSLLTYRKVLGHLNDPSEFLHSEVNIFPQVWLSVAHSSIFQRYDRIENITDQNGSNQRNRDCIRICHAAKILHLPWPLHWAFHLRLMLLAIQDTLLSIVFFTNVYKRVQENRWQHLADLTAIKAN